MTFCCVLSQALRHEDVLPSHTVQGLREDLRGHAVLMLQDQALLQGDRHGGAVFGAFAAGEAHAVQPPADLTGEVKYRFIHWWIHFRIS